MSLQGTRTISRPAWTPLGHLPAGAQSDVYCCVTLLSAGRAPANLATRQPLQVGRAGLLLFYDREVGPRGNYLAPSSWCPVGPYSPRPWRKGSRPPSSSVLSRATGSQPTNACLLQMRGPLGEGVRSSVGAPLRSRAGVRENSCGGTQSTHTQQCHHVIPNPQRCPPRKPFKLFPRRKVCTVGSSATASLLWSQRGRRGKKIN